MIFFYGDVHGCFTHVIDAVRIHRPAAIVLLGDIQPQRPLEVELALVPDSTAVWFIHGNHDTDSDSDYDNLFGSKLADRNIHGRVVDIAGLRVAGLGGIFRGQIWAPPAPWAYETQAELAAQCGKGNRWRGGMPRKHRSSIFPADYHNLVGQHADVLVTHEAPSAHPHGFHAIDALACSLGVAKVFHGHHHDRLDYSARTQAQGFAAFGVGLRGISDDAGRVIRVGERDEARASRARLIPGP
ncbi:MAG: metallophosphoesterase [Burkholderiaceae bacterium]